MLKFLLYCDLSTMNCSAADICDELRVFAYDYIQVNPSLWFFKYSAVINVSPLPKDEYLFYEHFEKFTDDNSVIFIEILHDNHYYILPEKVHHFLETD